MKSYANNENNEVEQQTKILYHKSSPELKSAYILYNYIHHELQMNIKYLSVYQRQSYMYNTITKIHVLKRVKSTVELQRKQKVTFVEKAAKEKTECYNRHSIRQEEKENKRGTRRIKDLVRSCLKDDNDDR